MLLQSVEVDLERCFSLTLLNLVKFEGLDTLALVSLCAHYFHHLESFRQILLLKWCVWISWLQYPFYHLLVKFCLSLWHFVRIVWIWHQAVFQGKFQWRYFCSARTTLRLQTSDSIIVWWTLYIGALILRQADCENFINWKWCGCLKVSLCEACSMGGHINRAPCTSRCIIIADPKSFHFSVRRCDHSFITSLAILFPSMVSWGAKDRLAVNCLQNSIVIIFSGFGADSRLGYIKGCADRDSLRLRILRVTSDQFCAIAAIISIHYLKHLVFRINLLVTSIFF